VIKKGEVVTNIFEFPENILFIDTLDVTNCILDDRKREIEYIAKNIWEGSKNIFSFLFGDDGCHGIKDILDDWLQEGIVSVIFYIPRETAKEIRDSLIKKMRTHTISEKIEHYLETQIRKNIPNFDIYNLSTTEELSDIFNVSKLKRDLDKDSKGEEQKIYLIGLRFAIVSPNRVGFYLNNTPIREESGLIYGNSNILTHRLKRGFMLIKADEGIEINFYDTDKFTSKDYDVGSDLEDLNFQDESLSFELYSSSKPIIIESRAGERLIFSLEQNSAYAPREIIDPTEMINRDTKIYLNSFFIPREKRLKFIKLLLIYKNDKKIIAGGEYHHGLLECDIIGDISIDLAKEKITFVNHSSSNLRFINFEDRFWKLDESSIYKEPIDNYSESGTSDNGIYTTVRFDNINLNDSLDTTVGEDEVTTVTQTIQTIKQEESFTFDVKEIEFNDSNISFDESGILISYSSFQIAKFEKEFNLNRTAYKMSNLGTLVDCFVERPKGKDFKWGSKVYTNHSDILGRAISSKPIILKNSNEGLFIESKLDSRYYLLQISSKSQKYILEGTSNSILIPNSELKDLKIDVINKGYKSRPLVGFTINSH
jgi:hypothetical protein